MEIASEQLKEFPLPEYKKRYMVSSLGKILSKRKQQYLATQISDKHNIVYINKLKARTTERYRVDNLVAWAFYGTSDKYLCHKDGDLLNDVVDNLEWIEPEKYLSNKYGETWRQIPQHDKYYVSSDGNIWSTYSEDIIKQTIISGYQSVTIGYPERKFHHVHRIVAEVFCPNPDNKAIVNHVDEDKLNNKSTNLEWVTLSENCIHSIKHRKPSRQPTQIDPNIRAVELSWLQGYMITENGNVYRKGSNVYLIQQFNDNGYNRTYITINGKQKNYYTHRLVAEAFLPPPSSPSQTQVNHKDMNRINNSYDNLEWMSQSENSKHSIANNPDQFRHLQIQVAQINLETNETIKIYNGLKEASKITGINSGSICKVCKNIRPSAGGFKWKYVD